MPLNQTPPGFTNLLYGRGEPGSWKVVRDDVAPLIPPATTKAPVVTHRAVLGQLNADPTDERFPLLIYENEEFSDFTLTTRFKIVEGLLERLAGIVFRFQNETNFYVIRANSIDNTLRFYKVVDGVRSPMLGPRTNVTRNVWHELKIECKGNKIRAWLDGEPTIREISDTTFTSGKFGYWTKSDAISYFCDTRITYVPRERLAQVLVRDALAKYSRLRDLKIFTLDQSQKPVAMGCKDPADLGLAGSEHEKRTIIEGRPAVTKTRTTITAVLPLRDRNGEPIAAVAVTMESFTGQTEQNALVRAMPIVKSMQERVQTLRELTE
jgi:hypothetical protein